MGVLYDYFSAPSDEEAGAVIDRVGGPGSQEVLVLPPEESRRGWFRKPLVPQAQLIVDPALRVFDMVATKGIDPVVQLGTLEELLTGRPYSENVDDPRNGHVVADRDQGEVQVLTLTESLVTALAGASDEQLAKAAVPWSQTEEFWGKGDPGVLTDFLSDLAGLARRARQRDHHLYCWACV